MNIEKSADAKVTRAKNRFLRSSKSLDSTGGSTRSLKESSQAFSISSGSAQFTSDEEHIERPKNVVRTSKKRAELEKIGQLTSNRIRYSSLENGTLYGREKEISLLRGCLDNVLGDRRSLVLVKGHSGIGKTALVATLKDPVTKTHRGLYLQGKFDLYLRDAQPYYGISTACRGIFHQISDLKGKFYSDIQAQLQEQLGNEAQILTKVIPELSTILGQDNHDIDAINQGTGVEESSKGRRDYGSDRSMSAHSLGASRATNSHAGAQRTKDKFLYLFRVFIRVITTYFAPLVIVLDDLQWADAASLELIESLVTYRHNPKLMLIGLYRSNEVETDSGHSQRILTTMIQQIKDRNDDGLVVTELQVGNLQLDAVKSVTMALLSLDDTTETSELAEVCFKRTQGNVFFLISFIAMMEDEGFLTYDLNLGIYKWDIDRVKHETGAASNLVELMNHKMAKLSPAYGLVLSVAAYLGATFCFTKLELAWRVHSQKHPDKDSTWLEERLYNAVQDGYIEALDNGTYRWIHDRVQEAALTLLPEEEAHTFKYRIGNVLRQELSEKALDASIFLVANLVNETPHEELQEEERIHVAQLNLRATQKAGAFSAFASAAKYSSMGISLLPTDRWTSHYPMTLQLYAYSVEAEEFVGDHAKMKRFCDEVLALDDSICCIRDKIHFHCILAYNVAASGNAHEAVAMIHQVLSKLGVKFAKSTAGRKVAAIAGLLRMQSALKAKTKEDIAQMTAMEDDLQIIIMKLLDKQAVYTYVAGSDLVALVMVKAARITITRGLCEYSPTAIAHMVTICTGVLNDPQGATKIGEDALALLKKIDTRAPSSATKFVVAGFGYAWTKPFCNVLPLLLEAYQDGMSTGDTESAGYGILIYVTICLMAGRTLLLVEEDCANYFKQMEDLKRKQVMDFFQLYWQGVQNLKGQSENSTVMQGNAIPDIEVYSSTHKGNPSLIAQMQAQQMRLYTTYGEHQKGADLFLKHGFDWPVASPGHVMYMTAVLCGGLSCFEMARTTKKRSYKSQAMKARSTVKGWVKKGNPNVRHYEALFDAEKAALGGKKKQAEQCYQSAIAMAARGGFIQDAALANERCGEFMLSVLSDKDGACYHIKQAVKFYTEWGAPKKVELLQEKYRDLFS